MTSIAVVGMGLLYADSPDPISFWHHIVKGDDLITEVPPDHWAISDYYNPHDMRAVATYSKRGSFIHSVPFNPMSFGIPPDRLASISSAQLLSLLVAQQVLLDATFGQYSTMDLSRVGIIMGAASIQEAATQAGAVTQWPIWEHAMRASGLSEHTIAEVSKRIQSAYPAWNESTFPGFLANLIPGRVANRFNLGATNLAVDAACASSLASIDIAIDALLSRKADMMLAGGADTANDATAYISFSKTPALSPTDDCRPFSAEGDGIVLGEGIGIIALKRLEDAIRDGNSIYALINGVGSSSDGRVKSIYAPDEAGQYQALKRCYAAADIDPATISLIEAHGTATKMGDAVEIRALLKLFGEEHRPKHPVALGSIKSQLGHTKAAAGVAGIIKVILALHNQILPPSIKCKTLNPLLENDATPFYLSPTPRPWFEGKTPRRASVSAFGFGGINYHVTLEEYPATTLPRYAFPSKKVALFFSGADAQELITALQTLLTLLPNTELLSLAKNSQSAKHKSLKCAIVVADIASAKKKIITAITHIQTNPKITLHTEGIYYHPIDSTGKIAFLFPGQGSQYLNMSLQPCLSFYPFKQLWDTLTTFMVDDNLNCEALIFPQHASPTQRERDETRMTQTQYAQVAIVATSLVYYQFFRKLGLVPDYLLGHSVGELAALCAADVYSIPDALQIAKLRTAAMLPHLKDNSGMLVVAANYPALLTIIEDNACRVEVSNFNGLHQTVLSGSHTALDHLANLLQQYGIAHKKLTVSHGFHNQTVKGAAEKFHHAIKPMDFQIPTIPVFSGVNALPHSDNPATIKAQLAKQMAMPVKFLQSAANLIAQGVRTFIEIGPRSALSDVLQSDYAGKKIHIIPCDKKSDPDYLHHTLSYLFSLGVPCDFQQLWDNILTEFPYRYNEASGPGIVAINGASYKLEKPTMPEHTEPTQPSSAPAQQKTSQPSTIVQSLVTAQIAYQDHLLAAHKAFLDTVQQVLGKEGGSLQEVAAVVEKITPVPVIPPVISPVIPPVIPPAIKIEPKIMVPKPAPTPQATDHQSQLIQMIAEKTGYDPSLLDLDMDLEADLGIDSLRRVEILSGLKDIDPELEASAATISPEKLIAIRTLRDILNLMDSVKKKS